MKSFVDAMRPHQILFNRRMAGEKLTDEENAVLDAGFPVQQAYDELVKALDEVSKRYNHFIPTIEELFVGYECEKIVLEYDKEFYYPSELHESYCLSDKFKWEKHTLTKSDLIELLKFPENGDLRNDPGCPILGYYRTPYITKEQIEAEGFVEETEGTWWKGMLIKRCEDGRVLYCSLRSNYSMFISQYVPSKPDEIWSLSMKSTVYDGYCKDINQFRRIIKSV